MLSQRVVIIIHVAVLPHAMARGNDVVTLLAAAAVTLQLNDTCPLVIRGDGWLLFVFGSCMLIVLSCCWRICVLAMAGSVRV